MWSPLVALEEGSAPTRRVETSGKRLVTFEAVIVLVVVVVDMLKVAGVLWSSGALNWTRLPAVCFGRILELWTLKSGRVKDTVSDLQSVCKGVADSLLHDRAWLKEIYKSAVDKRSCNWKRSRPHAKPPPRALNSAQRAAVGLRTSLTKPTQLQGRFHDQYWGLKASRTTIRPRRII